MFSKQNGLAHSQVRTLPIQRRNLIPQTHPLMSPDKLDWSNVSDLQGFLRVV